MRFKETGLSLDIRLILKKIALATKMDYTDTTVINQITQIQNYDLRIEEEKNEGSGKDKRAAHQ